MCRGREEGGIDGDIVEGREGGPDYRGSQTIKLPAQTTRHHDRREGLRWPCVCIFCMYRNLKSSDQKYDSLLKLAVELDEPKMLLKILERHDPSEHNTIP